MRTFVFTGFIVMLGFVVLFSSKEKDKATPLKAVEIRAPASSPPQPNKVIEQKREALTAIQSIENCYQSNTCDYPQTDSRSYEFAVGRDLAAKLKQFHAQYRQDPSAQEELKKLALRAFKVEDGFVQSVALDMFKDLPIDQERLQVLGEGLQTNPDPMIAEKALGELQRYINTSEEGQMQSIVQGILGQGAHFASQKVGENILNFINDRSFPSYQQLQQQLPAQSRVSRDLAGALREYRRQRTGG